jgi:hypothetical protein
MGLPIIADGKAGACAAHAAIYYLTHREFCTTGRYPSLSARFLYAAARAIEADANRAMGVKKPPPETDLLTAFRNGTLGVKLPAIAFAVATMGASSAELCPDDDLDDEQFGDFSLISQAAIADARTRAAGERPLFTGKRPSFESLKALIHQYGGVILALPTGWEWTWIWTAEGSKFTLDANEIMPQGALQPPSSPETIINHAIYACAYDEKHLLFPNSWGPGWGNVGWGSIGEDYMPYIIDGLIFEGGVREGRVAEMTAC